MRNVISSARAWVAATALAVAGTLVLVSSPSQAGADTSAGPAGPPGGHAHGMGPTMLVGPGMGRLLDAVKATPEQRAQVEKITQAAQDDLRARHEAGAKLRDQTMALFTQPTVDTAAVESLRQQMLAQHDLSTQRMLQAMVEVSRVLTVEQRQQMAQQLKSRDERGGHRHGDRGPGRG